MLQWWMWCRTHKLSILLGFIFLTYIVVTKWSQYKTAPLQSGQDISQQQAQRPSWMNHSTSWRMNHPRSWKVLKDIHNKHFLVSAVFDNRTAAPKRPAVLVFGFVKSKEELENSKVYCLLHYHSRSDSADGEEVQKKCLSEPAQINVDGQCRLTSEKDDARLVTYYCSTEYGDPPAEVQLSTNQECHENLSYPLKVFYQEQSTSYLGKVGVCLHSPLVGFDKNLELDLVNFVEMTRILGANSVTIYTSNIIDSDIENLVKTMTNRGRKDGEEGSREGGNKVDVEMVPWHGFYFKAPLHYYGQSLLMLDCIYRHIYKVELLVFQDLDEMILPAGGESWVEMVRKMDKKGRYANYQFLNNIFKPPQSYLKATPNSSRQATEPRYFKWTQRLDCFFPYSSRSKLIVRPDMMLTTCVHYVERTLKEKSKKTYKVPMETGLLAHYRKNTLNKCKYNATISDTTALKYRQDFRKDYLKS